MNDNDSFNLTRFIKAQDKCYQDVLCELGDGRKRSHWMWFIFPQVTGLGFSATSEFYAIKSKAEAKAYMVHPILGNRLFECVDQIIRHSSLEARDIFGFPDYLKFHSSLTLFLTISPEHHLLRKAIGLFFQGEHDVKTLEILGEI